MKSFLLLGGAALALLPCLALAGGPYGHYGPDYGWGGCATCGPSCWAMPGCCDRPVSCNDHLWDNYCQEKWCPTVDAAYLRPYWHAAPGNAGCAEPVAACVGPSCATPAGSYSSPVSYPRGRSNSVQPTPAQGPSRRPQPPGAPMPPDVQPPAPPMPPMGDESLQLKLLPLSRPGAPQAQR